MEFQVVVMFLDSFVDGVTVVRDVKVCTLRYKEYLMDVVWFERIDI
jgi:hypothetical protein